MLDTKTNSTDEPRDSGGFRENPAPQGLKDPPFIPQGEESGEWTRGGGSDPNAVRRNEDGEPEAATDEPDR